MDPSPKTEATMSQTSSESEEIQKLLTYARNSREADKSDPNARQEIVSERRRQLLGLLHAVASSPATTTPELTVSGGGA